MKNIKDAKNGKSWTCLNYSALVIFIALIFAFSFTAAAESQCLTDVSTSTSTSRATTGTSVSITATTTGSSCTVQTLSLVSTPSLTINDPSTGEYSSFSAGTPKTFTITAGTAGTFTYYAQGTTSAGAVTSTSTPIEFISPSDLTVSVSPSSASATQGNTFTLTISIQNPSSSDVSTSYALNLPSGSKITRQSGDPTSSSGTTISGSSTKTLSFVLKHNNCFTSETLTFDLGDSTGTASVSVTGNSTCGTSNATDSTSPGSGSGPGGPGVQITKSYSANKAIVNIPVIYNGTTESADIDATETSVRKISITVINIARSINIQIEKSGLPAGISAAPNNVLHYIVVSKTNITDDNIKSAKLEFRVEKTWINDNKIDEGKIYLYRYSNITLQWDKMETAKLSDDGTYVYYSAALPGLSVFAISGEKTPEGVREQQQQNATGNQTTNQTGIVLPKPGDFWGIAALLIIVFVLLGAAYFAYMKYFAKQDYVFRPPKK